MRWLLHAQPHALKLGRAVQAGHALQRIDASAGHFGGAWADIRDLVIARDSGVRQRGSESSILNLTATPGQATEQIGVLLVEQTALIDPLKCLVVVFGSFVAALAQRADPLRR